MPGIKTIELFPSFTHSPVPRFASVALLGHRLLSRFRILDDRRLVHSYTSGKGVLVGIWDGGIYWEGIESGWSCGVRYSLCIEKIFPTATAIVVDEDLVIMIDITVYHDDHFVAIIHAEVSVRARVMVGVAAS